MSPPVTVGQVYSVSMTGSKKNQASTGDRVLNSTEYRVTFEGRAEVLELDLKARPVRVVFTVGTFTKVENGMTVALLEPGSVVVADGSQQQKLSSKDGKALSEPVRDAFNVMYSAHKPDSATDDEVFGTKDTRAIGDRWPMNLALASEELARDGLVIPAGHLNGTFSLISKDKVGTTDCIGVRGQIDADSLTPSDLPLNSRSINFAGIV